jgi:VanZ family protein
MHPSPPRASLYLALYTLLIAFGSLYSADMPHDLGEWSLAYLFEPLPPYITRTDITTNLLAYTPFGYLLALTLARPQRRRRAIVLATLGGLALSVLLESLQGLLSDRIASNLDISLNILGTLAGALLTLHHNRWRRAGQALRRWRRGWFRAEWWAGAGLGLLLLWGFAQFSLLPFPGAGWLSLHLRAFDLPLEDIGQFNLAWFAAVFLEMAAVGAFTACLLKPGRYVPAMLLLFVAGFAMKLLAATLLLKLRAVGGVLSLESLAAFLLAFWFLLVPLVSRQRLAVALGLLVAILALRGWQADYLLWPIASVFNLVGLAKAAASFWPYLAIAVLAAVWLDRRALSAPPRADARHS